MSSHVEPVLPQFEGRSSTCESALLVESPLTHLGWCRVAAGTRQLVPPHLSVEESVRTVMRATGLTSLTPVYCRQRHTTNIHVLDGATPPSCQSPLVISECDGVIADRPGLALAVFTADCVPLVFVEKSARIFGVVHAGWRGTFGSIAVRAIEAIAALGGEVSNVCVWIGPAIGGCCYEVSEDLALSFSGRFRHLTTTEEPFLDGRMLDLVRLNMLQLIDAGVARESISWSGICTRHSIDRFYSYRAEGERAGRIVTLIGRTE